MRFSVLFVLACLLMAVSCQKNVVALSPMPKPTLEQRLIGTWKWVETVVVPDYGPSFKPIRTPASGELIYTFSTNGRLLLRDNGREQSGSYAIDTLSPFPSYKGPVISIKSESGKVIREAGVSLSSEQDTLNLFLLGGEAPIYSTFIRK